MFRNFPDWCKKRKYFERLTREISGRDGSDSLFSCGRAVWRAVECYSALTRRCVDFPLYVSELYAGAALHLAGFSSGTSVGALGARRGCSAQRVRFYYGVLRVVHVCLAFLLEAFASVHACCLTHSAKQDGLRCVAFLFREGRDRLFVRSHIVFWGYRAL